MSTIALIPAHNEEELIITAITSLQRQTSPPDRIIVVADNCTDHTIPFARACGVEIRETRKNLYKKAGALNQAFDGFLSSCFPDDRILVMDADSKLDSDFIENANSELDKDEWLGAVGGVFRGGPGGGFVGHLQRNEYARYARDVARLKGHCLVVTGTAAVFRAATLWEVEEQRGDKLPYGSGGVYDTTVLTEDSEISLALLHLGYRIKSPSNCRLTTEVMPTWRQLWNQRLRWKRGALENCAQYGLTRVTWRYWGRQIFSAVGVLVTLLYLLSFPLSLIMYREIHIQPIWLAVTAIFVIERIITVRYRGWRYMLLAATMYEMVTIDLFLQAVHAKAFIDAIFRRDRKW